MTAVAEKDLRESFSTSQVFMPLAIVPLIFVILYPSALLVVLRVPGAIKELAELVQKLPPDLIPQMAELDLAGTIAYFATVYLFSPFFLIIPVMVASILAANSFAGEKERHTLEGLLYTPLSDTELVVAKIAGAVVPAVVFAWMCFGIYAVLVNVLGNPLVGRVFFPSLNWWVLMVLVVPAASVFVAVITTWVSARVRGYQEANSVAGFAILPLVLLVIGQTSGAMLVGPAAFAVIGIVLVLVDVAMTWAVVRTFSREKAVSSYV
jgi:ABC-type Na+ efflux pump permease subunit